MSSTLFEDKQRDREEKEEEEETQVEIKKQEEGEEEEETQLTNGFDFDAKMKTLEELFPSAPIELLEEALEKTKDQKELNNAVEYIVTLMEKEGKKDGKRKRKDGGDEDEDEDELTQPLPTKFVKTDSELARELQEQENKNYQIPTFHKSDSEFARELQREEERLTKPIEKQKVTCLVCIEEFPIDDQFLSENCQHLDQKIGMCRTCATEYIRSEVNSSKFPIKCCVNLCEAQYSNDDFGYFFYF